MEGERKEKNSRLAWPLFAKLQGSATLPVPWPAACRERGSTWPLLEPPCEGRLPAGGFEERSVAHHPVTQGVMDWKLSPACNEGEIMTDMPYAL